MQVRYEVDDNGVQHMIEVLSDGTDFMEPICGYTRTTKRGRKVRVRCMFCREARSMTERGERMGVFSDLERKES